MHTRTKRVILVRNSTLLQASTKLAGWWIRDSLLVRVEVVICPATAENTRMLLGY